MEFTLSNPLVQTRRFKLGIFAANCSNGMFVTKVPERWDASWDNNLRLARPCDDAGLDFLLPIARWFGYGGQDINCQGDVLETTARADFDGAFFKLEHVRSDPKPTRGGVTRDLCLSFKKTGGLLRYLG